jgi:hypothetical protein
VSARHAASGGLLLRSSAVAGLALLQLLPQAVGLDQQILRISKLLLRLVAKPAKVGPILLFALREPVDQFEVDLGAVLLHDYAEGLPRLVPLAQLLKVLGHRHLFKTLVEGAENFVKRQFSEVLATPLCFPAAFGDVGMHMWD